MDCLLNRPKRLDCEPMDYLTGWSTAAVACWPLSDPEAMRGLQEAKAARRLDGSVELTKEEALARWSRERLSAALVAPCDSTARSSCLEVSERRRRHRRVLLRPFDRQPAANRPRSRVRALRLAQRPGRAVSGHLLDRQKRADCLGRPC